MEARGERLFYRIGEVAELVGVKPYVLRFWEREFSFLAPPKSESGHRLYREAQLESLLLVKKLLYQDRYSIQGAKKKIREMRRDGTLKTERERLREELGPGAWAAGPATPVELGIPEALDEELSSRPVLTLAPMDQAQAIAEAQRTLSELQELLQRPISELFIAKA